MENIVYCLGQWESEFICHRGDDLSDFKWFFSPEGEFLGGIMEFQVFFFQMSIGGTWKRSVPSLFSMLSHVLLVLFFWILSILLGVFLGWG